MSDPAPEVVLLDRRLEAQELRRLVARFEDMVKYVADLERGVIAIRLRELTFTLVGEGEPL